jgi:hypothetical protein
MAPHHLRKRAILRYAECGVAERAYRLTSEAFPSGLARTLSANIMDKWNCPRRREWQVNLRGYRVVHNWLAGLKAPGDGLRTRAVGHAASFEMRVGETSAPCVALGDQGP